MDIIPILASISLGFFLMATSYRHALVLKSNAQIVMVNLIFAIVSMLMYFLGYKLGLATMVTLAALSVSYMFANIYRSMLYTIIFILLFLFIGVYAGKQVNRLGSVKIFYIISSIFYLINGVVCIIITLINM